MDGLIGRRIRISKALSEGKISWFSKDTAHPHDDNGWRHMVPTNSTQSKRVGEG